MFFSVCSLAVFAAHFQGFVCSSHDGSLYNAALNYAILGQCWVGAWLLVAGALGPRPDGGQEEGGRAGRSSKHLPSDRWPISHYRGPPEDIYQVNYTQSGIIVGLQKTFTKRIIPNLALLAA